MLAETLAIVEDDAAIRAVLKVMFRNAGFSLVCEAERGDEGLLLVRECKPSLVLLDAMLPGLDGFEVLRQIRAGHDTAAIPVILLTARSAEADIVRGLELGADDYVTKPFSRQILLARVRAVLRRPEALQSADLSIDGLTFNDAAHSVRLAGRELDLTGREYRLLQLLLSRPGRVYSRSQIIAWAADDERDVTERAIDVQMVGLRRKLGTWAHHIETIRGVGYRLEP
ncbi:MAG: response regulator [Kiritimatiellia bacterium]